MRLQWAPSNGEIAVTTVCFGHLPGGLLAAEGLETMNLIKMRVAVACALSLLAGSALCADKAEKQLTCCQQAAAGGKDCKHKCCLAAHKEAKSCEKCNPNKEDLKLKNSDKKGAQKAGPK